MVNMVDRHVGEFMALLERIGQADNRIVFVCDDNGGHEYFRDSEHPRGFHAPNVDPPRGVQFRGSKGNLYEGGLRIPMILSWGGRIKPGRVSDLLCYFPDLMPTLTELTGAKAPPGIDGISVLPELLGEQLLGHKQQQHEYLYWEWAGQVAVRAGNWKAIRPGRNKPWELYDLSKDVSERHNVAAEHPDVLERLKKYAADEHEEPVEGTYFDRSLEKRDRWAKWGDTRPPARQRPWRAYRLPKQGLIPNSGWKVVRFSSESRASGRLAQHAIDGNPRTWWHSEFAPELKGPPDELGIDLGSECTIRGFYSLPRQDGSWNGTIRECQFT